MEDNTSVSPSEERLLDAQEIEEIAKSLNRPTARMQLESLAKKLRKEAASLKVLEAAGAGSPKSAAVTTPSSDDNDTPMTTTTTTVPTTSPMQIDTEPSPLSSPSPIVMISSTQKYTTIDKFAFDAGGYSDRFVTLYISLPGVGDVPKDQITCSFTKDSFDLIVWDWNGKSYRLFKDHLEKDIVPDKSKYIVKADKIVVKLQKVKGEYGSYDYWSKLTDPKRNDKKSKDPSSSITDLMREMYENGDDNMKKMIGETMLKQRNGELDKSDPLAGMDDM